MKKTVLTLTLAFVLSAMAPVKAPNAPAQNDDEAAWSGKWIPVHISTPRDTARNEVI